MIKSTKILSLIVVMYSSVSFAQKQWTLQECITYAEENNISLAQFELDYQVSSLDKLDAIGNFLPSLNASMRTSGNTGLALDPTTNTLVSKTIFSASGDLSASVTIYDGLRNQNRLNRA